MVGTSVSTQSCGDGGDVFGEGVTVAGTEDDGNVDHSGLCGVDTPVGGKSAVKLVGSAEMIRLRIGLRVVGHVGISEELRREEIAEVDGLATGDKLFGEAGNLMKPEVPNGGFIEDLFPVRSSRIKSEPF